jgi:hypothetical protein
MCWWVHVLMKADVQGVGRRKFAIIGIIDKHENKFRVGMEWSRPLVTVKFDPPTPGKDHQFFWGCLFFAASRCLSGPLSCFSSSPELYSWKCVSSVFVSCSGKVLWFVSISSLTFCLDTIADLLGNSIFSTARCLSPYREKMPRLELALGRFAGCWGGCSLLMNFVAEDVEHLRRHLRYHISWAMQLSLSWWLL